MKTLIPLFVFLIVFLSECKSQVTQDYPFKTYLDSANNLYTAGFTTNKGQKDIFVQKFDSSGIHLWSREFFSFEGNDRGLDLKVDRHGYTYVTGYVSNLTFSNDIILLILNPDGTILYSSIYEHFGDDKGMGIDITAAPNGYADEIFITGYVSSDLTDKDIIIKKYSGSGDSLWQKVYNKFSGDDVATDILLDNSYAYVVGYTYQGPVRGNEIMFQTYSKDDGALNETLIDYKPGSNEMPTEMVIPGKASNTIQKSRVSITSISENFTQINISRYHTLYLNPSSSNEMNIRWSKDFINGLFSRNNTATSIAADSAGDIYVTGYVPGYDNINQNNGLDFATIKYKWDRGQYGWNSIARFFNYDENSTTGTDDKASSIKVNNAGDIFVAGSSDASPSGFSIVKYVQHNGDPNMDYFKGFTPGFMTQEQSGQKLNKWATIELSSDGTPLLVVMGWDENSAYWAAQKFDSNGNVSYTIDDTKDIKNISSENSNKATIENYPNPFNPSTTITYNIPFSVTEENSVQIKIFNPLGQEISKLVDERKPAGNYSVKFDGSELSSGMYFYILSVNGYKVQTKRMMLLK